MSTERENRLLAAIQKLIAFNRSRLIVAMLYHDENEYKKNVADNFNTAKMLSDFVGMLVRYAFAQAAASYFWHKGLTTEGMQSFFFSSTAIFAFLYTIAFGIRIFFVILLYWGSNIHQHDKMFPRVILWIVAIAQAIVLQYAITTLVRELSGKAL